MIAQTLTPCPECKQLWYLLEGRFPAHTARGLDCPMSGREPQEWPLPSEAGPAQSEPGDASSTTSPTLEEPPARAQRKVRADKGTKRPAVLDRKQAIAIYSEARQSDKGKHRAQAPGNRDSDGLSEHDAKAPAPKAKRSRRGYIVASVYETFVSLEAAKAAMGEALKVWNQHLEGSKLPTLIAGRVLETTFVPGKTTPPTVRIVRSKP